MNPLCQEEVAMTNREFCLERRNRERKAFVSVLKAVPQGRLDYRPHPRSRTAAELAWLIAHADSALIPLIEKGSVEWKETPPPAKIEEIQTTYERNAKAVDELIAKTDDRVWDQRGKFFFGSPTPWEDTIQNFVWGFLHDAIHHRGQLTTYLRPMGGKVPSIYGPSADDPGM
jgi:uncharacterized damage-inducible protein DinB